MIRRRFPAPTALFLGVAVVSTLLAGGCGADPESPPRAEVTVLAASSLTDVFSGIEADLENEHPDLDITVAFAGSSTIVSQVNHGAPADLIVLASEESLDALQPQAGHQAPVIVATNRLALAVPADNPAHVSGLADLSQPERDVVVCDVQVPCGAAADEALRRAGVDAHIVSREADVRSVLTKLRLGEADAGLVYATDVAAAAGQVAEVPIPADYQGITRYPALALNDNPRTATVLAAIAGESGRARLAEHGFGLP